MAVSEGYPVREAVDGATVPISEADASMEDATTLITVTQRFADEHGLWLREYVEGRVVKLYAGEWRTPDGA